MRDLNNQKSVRRGRFKRAFGYWGKAFLWNLLKLADWIIDGVTTVLMITGAGCFAGVGFGVGLAIVVALI